MPWVVDTSSKSQPSSRKTLVLSKPSRPSWMATLIPDQTAYRAQTLPAFSELPVSSLRGTLGARLEFPVCVPEVGASVAMLSCISDAGRRKAHGCIGIESTLLLVPPGVAIPSYDLEQK